MQLILRVDQEGFTYTVGLIFKLGTTARLNKILKYWNKSIS